MFLLHEIIRQCLKRTAKHPFIGRKNSLQKAHFIPPNVLRKKFQKTPIFNSYKHLNKLSDTQHLIIYMRTLERAYIRIYAHALARAYYILYSNIFAHFLRVNSNLRPPSGKLLTRIVPPCRRTAFFTMASPRPVPPILRLPAIW